MSEPFRGVPGEFYGPGDQPDEPLPHIEPVDLTNLKSQIVAKGGKVCCICKKVGFCFVEYEDRIYCHRCSPVQRNYPVCFECTLCKRACDVKKRFEKTNYCIRCACPGPAPSSITNNNNV